MTLNKPAAASGPSSARNHGLTSCVPHDARPGAMIFIPAAGEVRSNGDAGGIARSSGRVVGAGVRAGPAKCGESAVTAAGGAGTAASTASGEAACSSIVTLWRTSPSKSTKSRRSGE